MPDTHLHEQEQAPRRSQPAYLDAQSTDRANRGPSAAPAHLDPSLLHDPRLTKLGNAPIRDALMQRAQQTVGNRAVKRAIQPCTWSPTQSHVPVQRRAFSGLGDEMLNFVSPRLEGNTHNFQARSPQPEGGGVGGYGLPGQLDPGYDGTSDEQVENVMMNNSMFLAMQTKVQNASQQTQIMANLYETDSDARLSTFGNIRA